MFPSEVLVDSFTGPDGTAISAHAPEVGGTWVVVANHPQLKDNKLSGQDVGSNICSMALTGKRITIGGKIVFNHANASTKLAIKLDNGAGADTTFALISGAGSDFNIDGPGGSFYDANPVNAAIGIGTHDFKYMVRPGYAQAWVDGKSIGYIAGPDLSFVTSKLTIYLNNAAGPDEAQLAEIQVLVY